MSPTRIPEVRNDKGLLIREGDKARFIKSWEPFCREVTDAHIAVIKSIWICGNGAISLGFTEDSKTEYGKTYSYMGGTTIIDEAIIEIIPNTWKARFGGV